MMLSPAAPSMGTAMRGRHAACTRRKATIEQGPKRVGLTVSFCSRPFLLFKKAASSNRHHKRSVHDGSHSTSISSDCFKKPAKPWTKVSSRPLFSSKPAPLLQYTILHLFIRLSRSHVTYGAWDAGLLLIRRTAKKLHKRTPISISANSQ